MVVLEPLVEVLAGRGGEGPEGVVDLAAVACALQAEAYGPQEVGGALGDEVRGRHIDERHDQLGDPGEVLLEAGDLRGVVGGETGDLGSQRLRLLVDQQTLAVVEEVQGRPRRVDLETALVEAHVAPHGAAQHAEHVGAAGGMEAGGELLGDAGAADDVTALEHQRAHPRPRQVEGGDEPVVAAADDDRAVPFGAVSVLSGGSSANVVRPHAAHATVSSDFIRVTP